MAFTRWLLISLAAITLLAATRAMAADDATRPVGQADLAPLRNLPVMDRGRLKPLDTLARETVRLVTGRETFGIVTPKDGGAAGEQSIGSVIDPLDLLLDWSDKPDEWAGRPVLYVPLLELRAKLGMPAAQKWITPEAVAGDSAFGSWVQQIEARRNQAMAQGEELKLTRLEESAEELAERLRTFNSAADLRLLNVLPDTPTANAATNPPPVMRWRSLGDLYAGPSTGKMADVLRAWDAVRDAREAGDSAGVARAAEQFRVALASAGGAAYPNADAQSSIDRETLYNRLKPFRITWILYFCALIVMALSAGARSPRSAKWSWRLALAVFGLAILFHAGAFVLRCSITGFAPVTNMYETLIWVALMACVFAFVLERIYKRRVIAVAGAAAAVVATIVADTMPPEYGSAIHVLTPVLRSNYWLTIHVLTIVSSYAAFALALVLGNVVLGQVMWRSRAKRRQARAGVDSKVDSKMDRAIPIFNDSIRANLLFIYRAVQVGVLLVAAGTILGALWADVSWGRFWGWDPKEVWALIVLLTYLALLHGRFAGWVGPFGLAAGAVLCFTAVLMSWYGVNFVLGVGLHAYGFGAGGQTYVGAYLLAQWAYVLLAYLSFRRASGSKGTGGALPEGGSGFPIQTAEPAAAPESREADAPVAIVPSV